MKNRIKRLITIGIVASSISMLPLIGANAEWKQDSNGWWNTEGNSYSIGWRQIDSKWYYFNNDGYMVTNTEINGYKIDNNGVWIQNTITNSNNTTNTSTNVENTSNSNNNSNTSLTNNIDNSTKTTANTTLNNTGVINANTTNNVTVDNTSKSEDEYYKELKKSEQKSDDNLKAYYQKQLDEAKSDLNEAQQELSNIKDQKTNQVYTKQADGSWQFVYVADTQKISQCEQKVKSCQDNVDYYEKLVK